MALKIALKNITFIDCIIIIIFIAALVLSIVIYTLIKREKGNKDTIELFYQFIQYAIEALPLLGTLGTVVALINNTINTDELQSNFLYALTSTFWGLIGAIVLKFIDSMCISRLMAGITKEGDKDEFKKNH